MSQTIKVVLVAWEAINQELGVGRVIHGLLNEPTSDLNRNDLAIFDITVDQVSQVRTGVARSHRRLRWQRYVFNCAARTVQHEASHQQTSV